jgi:chromate transporter
MTDSKNKGSNELRQLARLYLKLGVVAFGGPAAHIAMMEDEIVKRRNWISHKHFLDLLGATNLIPGPNSTQMAIQIGYIKAGWKGLIVAGLCFILPAVSITLVLAHLYVSFGTTPQLGALMLGVRSAVIAIILAALYRLGKPVVKNRLMMFVGVLVVILNLLHVDEVILLLGGGIVGLLWQNRLTLSRRAVKLFALAAVPALMISSGLRDIGPLPGSATLWTLATFFFKIGSILYGSGYVLVAFLQGGLVGGHHWLTQSQLLDAVAVGQFTPGPVLSTATFIGYVILGIPGAAVSTIGIFLPSFVYVLIIGRLIPKLRTSQLMRGFLDGVNAAALGLMLAVSVTMGIDTLNSLAPVLIFCLAAIALLLWKPNAAWIVGGSALLSWLISLL